MTFMTHFSFLLLKFTATERQGPAVGVIPVFTPRNPSSRSLFVLCQVCFDVELK